jgi:UDP-glucuronate decarboxylase
MTMLVETLLDDARQVISKVDFSSLYDVEVLVTGASGLIGSHIVATLKTLAANSGRKLKIYCNIRSAPPSHIEELIHEAGFHWIQVDLSDQSQYGQIPQADLIFHAAGYAQPLRFMQAPVDTIAVNACATLALLKRLKPGGRIIFLSSTEVYSGLHDSKCSEADVGATTPLHARACYIEGKRCAEAICASFFNQGVHAFSARLGDVFGPGTRRGDERSLNVFIYQALMQKTIHLRDRGKAIRTFGYISDIVEMLWKVVLSGKWPIYNIGGQIVTTIGDMAIQIARIAGAEVIFPEEDSSVQGAPAALVIDGSRYFSEFEKNSFVTLEAGLERTIAWQKLLYGA